MRSGRSFDIASLYCGEDREMSTDTFLLRKFKIVAGRRSMMIWEFTTTGAPSAAAMPKPQFPSYRPPKNNPKNPG